MRKRNKTTKRLSVSVAIIALLCVCLAFTSFALVYSMVSVDNNLFVTGTVKINLNDGRPIILEEDLEPGMTVKKDFFIQNESSCDVYYKLYFQNVSGGLADVLEVTICDGDKVLFAGTPAQLTKTAVGAADDILRLNEIRSLRIYFHFPEEVGNEAQRLYLSFDFAADAVQVRNNTEKSFA